MEFSNEIICLLLVIFSVTATGAETQEGAVSVIVINSYYNNSSVVNGTNNFSTILDKVINATKPITGSESKTKETNHVPASTLKPHISSTTPAAPTEHKVSPYFGTILSPYVRTDGLGMNDYTEENIKTMLEVVKTKSHSILTIEDGYYASPLYYGPYNGTSTSKIAITAAKINLKRKSSQFTVSQGAYILSDSLTSLRFPDLDAAFFSAHQANSIFPGTVSGITVFLQDPSGSPLLGLTTNTAYYAALLLGYMVPKAHSVGLKMGVVVSFCDQLLDSNDNRGGNVLLHTLALRSDYIICEFFPQFDKNQFNFDLVKDRFSVVKSVFAKFAPALDVQLLTGIHPYYVNLQNFESASIHKYWNQVESWATSRQQNVFMYQAFDTFEKAEVGYGRSEFLTGYWKWTQDGQVLVKG